MKILVTMFGSMGDVILGSDFFYVVRRKHPDAHVTALVSANTCDNPLTYNPLIDRCLNIIDVQNILDNGDVRSIFGEHFDIVYFMCHHTEPYALLDKISYDRLYIECGADELLGRMGDFAHRVPKKYLDASAGRAPFDLGDVGNPCTYRNPFYYPNSATDDVFRRWSQAKLWHKPVCLFMPFSAALSRDIQLETIPGILDFLTEDYHVVLSTTFRRGMHRTAGWLKKFEEIRHRSDILCLIDDGQNDVGVMGLAAMIEYSDVLFSTHCGAMSFAGSFCTPNIVVSERRFDRTKPFRKIPHINISLDYMRDLKVEHVETAFDCLKRYNKFQLTASQDVLDYRTVKS